MATVSDAPPRSPRREATRRRLLEAASQALAERGFYGASVEDICERAGFTRGAFYSNFASREELVIELAEQRNALLRQRITELSDRDDLTPRQILHEVLALWADQPGERQQWLMLQTELMLHAIRDPETGATWRAVVTQSQAEIADALEALMRRRGLTLPIDSQGLVRLLLASFQGGALQHLLDPEHVGPDELEEQVITVLEAALEGPAPAA